MKNRNCIYVIVSMAMLGVTLIAMHDMQMALGVGLYISICAEAEERLVYDLVTDGLMFAALVLLVLMPSIKRRGRRIEGFFEFLLLFLAFMPQLSPSYIVHLFNNSELFEVRRSFAEGDILVGVLEGIEYSASMLQMLVPLLVFVCIGYGLKKRPILKSSYLVIGGVLLLTEIGILVFPGFAELLCFLMTYGILIVIFDVWNSLTDEYKNMSIWKWILFGGLGLRSVYRLLEMMSQYHM